MTKITEQHPRRGILRKDLLEKLQQPLIMRIKLPPLVIPGLPLERPENPDKKPRFSGAGCGRY